MATSGNWLDQELDIQGNAGVNNRDLTVDEANSYGASSATGTGDTIGGAAPSMTLTDAGATFTVADVGKWIQIAGATTGANDGEFLISAFTSSTVITYQNAAGVAEAFAGTWTIRRPYSALDDHDFHRSDRQDIKGTTNHYDAVPTYVRPTAIGTNVPANLTNIASKTTDAMDIMECRELTGQTTAEGDTFITLTSGGNLKHTDAVDLTGVPTFDAGPDTGSHEDTYVEIYDPVTGAALTVDGRAVGDITVVAGADLVDAETVVLDDGTNPAVTFEFDDDSSVVESATLRQVVFAGGDTATQVRDALIAAINAAPALNITASIAASDTLDLVNNEPGTAGNVVIVETVVDAGFTFNGMAGGTADNGFRIFARTEEGGSTSPNTVEVHFRKVAKTGDISTGAAYTWEKLQPTSVNVIYAFNQRLDLLNRNALRKKLVNGLVGDAGTAQERTNIRSVLGMATNDTYLENLTNLTDFFPFSELPNDPDVTEALNQLNEEIGNRDYTGPYLTDGQTITASLQALSNAIGASTVTRVIERLGADVDAGTAHTLPGGNTYTLDGTDNGLNMWVFWRGLLQDPGPVATFNNYAETSITQITPYSKVKQYDHINYFILQ